MKAGGALVGGAPLERAVAGPNGFVLEVGGAEPSELATKVLVNSAGLHAQAVARRIVGLDPAHIPPAHYAKGNYYALPGRSPFTRLIYPVPEPGGLGVHLTLDLAAQARFGPDVQWLSAEARRGHRLRRRSRTQRPLLFGDPPLLAGAPERHRFDSRLQGGVRPKLQGPGEPPSDFISAGAERMASLGLMNLFGIESPSNT